MSQQFESARFRRWPRLAGANRGSDSLQYWGLLVLLLVGYAFLVYTVIISVVTAGLGYDIALPSPLWLDGLALGAVALGFLPAHRWLSGRVADLVYGEHDNPYPLIARLNDHLQRMTNPAATLPVLAESVAAGLRLPYVAIEPEGDTPRRYEAGVAPDPGALVRLPINYLERPVGRLLVSPRKPGQPLSPGDMTLLHDIGRQIGVALYAAGLTAELEGALKRLVQVREEERRRIRNDLHDGLGPALAAMQLQLGGVRRALRHDPAVAERLIDELKGDLRRATAEIRRLVYDLRPPLLDELGLAGALRSALGQDEALLAELHLPDPLPELPAAVEVAVYRIAREALHNVARHAGATGCTVALAHQDGMLVLQVSDDGVGWPAGVRYGVGLNSMRQRAEELGGHLLLQDAPGGGAELIVRLPLGDKP